MNKSDLVKEVAARTGRSAEIVSCIIDSALSGIVQCLGNGDKIVLRDFGTFEPIARSERVARNVRSNEEVIIPARLVPGFKPGKHFKDVVKGGGS